MYEVQMMIVYWVFYSMQCFALFVMKCQRIILPLSSGWLRNTVFQLY